MSKLKKIGDDFQKGLEKLGFERDDDSLFLIEEFKKAKDYKKLDEPQIAFHIEKARDFDATAVYLRKQLNGSYKPQVYLYDFTGSGIQEESVLTETQKKIWSSGEVPLVCVFYDTEIKIIDCTTHITRNDTPAYIFESLDVTAKSKKLYDKEFAIKIKSGVFWEEEENINKFEFKNSSYDKLIENIKFIVSKLKQKNNSISDILINKIIVQSILIRYLEERVDNNNNKLLSSKDFKKYNKSNSFNDVLRKGKFVDLLNDLNDPKKGFNGNVFKWTSEEQSTLQNIDLTLLAELLESDSSLNTGQRSLWRYFEFRYIPVELISRLYEEFLGKDKKNEGLYYTPSHLVKLLVDECLPLKRYNEINLDTFQVLDPACGSGIFLVTTFKRLIQIWRLQNKMKAPRLTDLKKLLLNIYGIDKEEQAIRLALFSLSLALCDGLDDLSVKLKFDDLRKTNLIKSDFFDCKKSDNVKFDLIIGNPPFKRGAIKNYSQYWEFEDQKVNIPQGQIALKFLSESLPYLKRNGLLCLIIKSSGLLYNSSSDKYKKVLFSNYNVIQLLDFTALARNKSLWENGADVASAAIFVRNEKPNFKNNILHLTFRRTKATKERIVFELDDYDLHFINRQTAIDNSFIWKNNLVGGGRIKSLIEKFQSFDSFQDYLKNNNCVAGEGFIIGTKGNLKPNYVFEIPTLPTEAINETGIDYSLLEEIDTSTKFVKVPPEGIFKAPNVIIWENIGNKKLPVFYNEKSFSFKHKLIGINSVSGDRNILKFIVRSFEKFSDSYRFYIYATSSQVFVNLNTAILKKDLMQLPFIVEGNKSIYSEFDNNIISDVNTYMKDFIRHGEHSKAVKPINKNEIENNLRHYGTEFSNTLNLIYVDQKKKFRLSDVVTLSNSFIAAIFKYDDKTETIKFHNDISNLEPGIIEELSNHKISERLSVNRIIKLYPGKDTIVFIKPNQYRYWLSLIAYRDADKCFADFSHMGY